MPEYWGVLFKFISYTRKFEMNITKILVITAITALVIATPTTISFPIVTVIATSASPEHASSDAANGATITSSSGGHSKLSK